MKNLRWSKVCVVVLAILLIYTPFHSVAEANQKKVDNVILLIPDGMGASYVTATRIFKGDHLSFEPYLKGMVKTGSADTNVTDSAAAGTAMATGVKTNNGVVSMTPDGEILPTILQAAKAQEKATGLVATSRITHATPAVFASHTESRQNEEEIAPQFLNVVDVILGGGRDMFLPADEGGKQGDRHLIKEYQAEGYQYVSTTDELNNTTGDKVLGLFAMSDLKYDIDREPHVPSLAEMTAYAIEQLQRNDHGFFLMVEGSQIDWAGHAHDPVAAITDTIAFDQAVEEALDFAQEDKNTLVIVVGDHETGGMNIGTTAGGYNENIQALKQAQASSAAIADKLKTDAQWVLNLEKAILVDEEVFVPLRETIDTLGGQVKYQSATNEISVDLHDQDNQTIVIHPNDERIQLVNNNSYVSLTQLSEWLNLDVGVEWDDETPTYGYFTKIQSIVSELSGIDVTEDDVLTIVNSDWGQLGQVIGPVLSEYAMISWGSRYHTGVDVPLYAYGKGAGEFIGLIDNTELPQIISYLQGLEAFDDEQAFMKSLRERRGEH
ncbi:alkaline phosphatase [Caldalkalibacillus salinus]|uniref:alkaline phosphatase n=1 Tax=Caldalkalibacillus salinus TaxID=2803787 RepID=UPI0019215F2D|nr:alkaline phosphatase [Caldalkalibacillus salinus]